MSGPTIVLVGNLSEGFKAVGPFPDHDAAAAWATGAESWVMTLEAPEPKKKRHVDDLLILQESPERKAEWLADAQKRVPVGTRVKVVTSDEEAYIGATGVVEDYDVGGIGDWPLVGVVFDTPIVREGHAYARDGFYCDGDPDDEIVPLEAG